MSTSQKPSGLPQDHPVASRKTVQEMHDEEGVIVKLDATNFGIQSSAGSNVLLPVNLPQAFEQEGLKILFSGQVKEVNLNEMMAGQPLVLTEVQEH